MKNLKKYILISLIGALAVSSIAMTVVTATSGAEVSALKKEEAAASDQKRSLENILVKTLSMGELQDKSVSLGYEKPVNLVYIAAPVAVAKLP